MVDQIPKTKSKPQVLQLKAPCLCLKTLMVGLCVLVLSICSVLTATCPASVPSSAIIVKEQCSFTGYTTIQTFKVAMGSVSNSLYYSYQLTSSSYNAAVRKVDASDSQIWVVSFAFDPIVKSLSVDAAEQYVYLARKTNPLTMLKLATSDGSIVSQHHL